MAATTKPTLEAMVHYSGEYQRTRIGVPRDSTTRNAILPNNLCHL
ncbi:hypothetical protein [Aeoliella mucimassa]|uniref:Uncharacterized protein n=1 Tax=Aeoliella mucimassa TaxID=2527972 RepID=A0A518AMV4_9BACT|nr:hypothetical protein [Aeoliella mucimassa]QDU56043.1 hypothetical protein Pan181_22450 [Aeoliella mucimassa]